MVLLRTNPQVQAIRVLKQEQVLESFHERVLCSRVVEAGRGLHPPAQMYGWVRARGWWSGQPLLRSLSRVAGRDEQPPFAMFLRFDRWQGGLHAEMLGLDCNPKGLQVLWFPLWGEGLEVGLDGSYCHPKAPQVLLLRLRHEGPSALKHRLASGRKSPHRPR